MTLTNIRARKIGAVVIQILIMIGTLVAGMGWKTANQFLNAQINGAW